MSQLTKAALICGGGSMIILISILINLPIAVQILLLLAGLAISVYGVLSLVKMIIKPLEKSPKPFVEEIPATIPKKKKGPSSTL